MTDARVKVVRIHYRHPGLEVDAVKGVGFRAVQGDEWRGPVRKFRGQAVLDAAERNAELRASLT